MDVFEITYFVSGGTLNFYSVNESIDRLWLLISIMITIIIIETALRAMMGRMADWRSVELTGKTEKS